MIRRRRKQYQKKRKKRTRTPSPIAYTSLIKDALRYAVVVSFLGSDRIYNPRGGGGRIVYLDGPQGEATAFFLRHVPAEQLEPINADRGACNGVEAASGLSATHADIFDRLASLRGERAHVVWLDLEVTRAPNAGLAQACRVAHTLHLTLATRRRGGVAAVQREARQQLAHFGMRILSVSVYAGRRGPQTQMVHLIAEHRRR